MCYPVTCKNCGKTTWGGCGQHITSVKAQVPASQWCTCTEEEKKSAKGSGFFHSLFGR
ncbi:Uncharacterised protein [Arcanobacterium haemolyticum]|nr:Uncharacterised protein [Arcanobacterium haemolyticum]